MIDTRWTRHSTRIQKNTNVGFENGTECVEEPSMGVDLFLIFFLETKDDLNRDDSLFVSFNFQTGIDGNLLKGSISVMRWEKKEERQHTLCCIFIDMGRDLPTSDLGLNKH